MTEAEWLAARDPVAMLDWLTPRGPSERKLRLFLVACARRAWDRMTSEGMRDAVEVGEQYADGRVTTAELAAAHSRYYHDFPRAPAGDRGAAAAHCLAYGPAAPSRRLVRPHYTTHWFGVKLLVADHASGLLREVFGNPFRFAAADPAWRTPHMVRLAEGIYEDREFDRLTVLADALEDAGCDDPDMLAHCRGDGPHVRGCWVIDILLDKE